jgi:hypothetical protein
VQEWVAPSAIAAVVAIVLFVLAGRRDRGKVKSEARAKFRAAFSAAAAELSAARTDTFHLFSLESTRHDAAILEFRPYIDPHDLSAFDAAVAEFQRCRAAVRPAMVRRAGDATPELSLNAAIQAILAFARKA